MAGCDGSLVIYFVYPTKMKQNHETIPSRFFPEQTTKKRFVLRHLCPAHEVSTGVYKKPLSAQIVNSFGQESVHLTVMISLGISKTMSLTTMSQQAHVC